MRASCPPESCPTKSKEFEVRKDQQLKDIEKKKKMLKGIEEDKQKVEKMSEQKLKESNNNKNHTTKESSKGNF